MITINNLGPPSTVKADSDLRKYIVKINHKPIAHFLHYRKDGLAMCLEKAARAVRRHERLNRR